ncbi:hypothetical protein [Pinibacter aurantiacus]|uniref:Uncharacterized protein n=1 Tax=Pinibacter aurantiacus TaxID=2851599 RepID=A0A9E2W815_9BACT|nr:hypothetical protein [Pinibacter aurantiacus]MBV4357347.1 hypothetical protein [Pinibacter aurantiacus]
MYKLESDGEEPFVIEVANTCFIIQPFQVEEGITFITTIREKEIRFEPDPETGDLKPDYYPIDVDRDVIDAIADGIEKYCL